MIIEAADEVDLRAKFDAWAENNYNPDHRYGSGERPLSLDGIWETKEVYKDFMQVPSIDC